MLHAHRYDPNNYANDICAAVLETKVVTFEVTEETVVQTGAEEAMETQ